MELEWLLDREPHPLPVSLPDSKISIKINRLESLRMPLEGPLAGLNQRVHVGVSDRTIGRLWRVLWVVLFVP